MPNQQFKDYECECALCHGFRGGMKVGADAVKLDIQNVINDYHVNPEYSRIIDDLKRLIERSYV